MSSSLLEIEHGELSLTIEQLKRIPLNSSSIESNEHSISLAPPDSRILRSLCVHGCIFHAPVLNSKKVVENGKEEEVLSSGSFVLTSLLYPNQTIKVTLLENTFPFCVKPGDLKVGTEVEVRGTLCRLEDKLYISASFVIPNKTIYVSELFYKSCMTQTLTRLYEKKKEGIDIQKQQWIDLFSKDKNYQHFGFLAHSFSLDQLSARYPTNPFYVHGSLTNIRWSLQKAEFASPFFENTQSVIVCLDKKLPFDETEFTKWAATSLVLVLCSFRVPAELEEHGCQLCIHHVVFYASPIYEQKEKRLDSCKRLMDSRISFFKQMEEGEEANKLEACFGCFLSE